MIKQKLQIQKIINELLVARIHDIVHIWFVIRRHKHEKQIKMLHDFSWGVRREEVKQVTRSNIILVALEYVLEFIQWHRIT